MSCRHGHVRKKDKKKKERKKRAFCAMPMQGNAFGVFFFSFLSFSFLPCLDSSVWARRDETRWAFSFHFKTRRDERERERERETRGDERRRDETRDTRLDGWMDGWMMQRWLVVCVGGEFWG